MTPVFVIVRLKLANWFQNVSNLKCINGITKYSEVHKLANEYVSSKRQGERINMKMYTMLLNWCDYPKETGSPRIPETHQRQSYSLV